MTLLDEFASLQAARTRLLNHPVYRHIDDLPKLRTFMSDHVFAVWDFMSIAKRLQREITCVELPWRPARDAALARFINEIILSEETDVGPDGQPVSHLEMYLEAMEEVGADTTRFYAFLNQIQEGVKPKEAMLAVGVPEHVRAFVNHTMAVALEGEPVEVAANFLYGREDVIPEMFQRIVDDGLSAEDAPAFHYYLQRHIELDGDSHGPLAKRLLERLTGDIQRRHYLSIRAANDGVLARIALWDGVLESLQPGWTSHEEADTPNLKELLPAYA